MKIASGVVFARHQMWKKEKETIEYVEKKFKYPAVIVQEVNWLAFH